LLLWTAFGLLIFLLLDSQIDRDDEIMMHFTQEEENVVADEEEHLQSSPHFCNSKSTS
jgi:hypothetical protein